MRDEIIKKIKEIPAFPPNAQEILEQIRKPESTIEEISKTIQKDPLITANILRLANSAYYAGPKEIATVNEAIIRLGTNRIQEIIIASAVFPMALKPLKGYDLPSGELIRHLVGTAIASELLSKELKIPLPPHTFTVGLLHDIGKIILGTFIEIDVQPILKKAFDEKISFEKAEKEILGIDHSEVGALLMREWNFPDTLVIPVLFHHDPENAPKEHQLTTDLIHVASNICLECGIGTGIDGLNYSNNENSIERLQITISIVETVMCKLLNSINEFMSGIKIN